MKTKAIQSIFNQFLDDPILEMIPYGNGHINDTFRITTESQRYILQCINSNVFKNARQLMENMTNVTQFIAEKVREEGGDPRRETLNLMPTKDGSFYFLDHENNYWRLVPFIDNTVSYDLVENHEHFYESGKAFGKFQYQLRDYPVETLHATIKDFHNTPARYKRFKEVVALDPVGRVANAQSLIDFVDARAEFMDILWDHHEAGNLPLKVTHNDTKLNNVLLDSKTGKAVCVVDLDTVMPGFSLDDFGDSIRFGASTAVEDEPNLDKVNFDKELYKAYAQGFIEGANGSLSPLEIELFPVGAKMMTLECGMRFLTDYLEGDVYFKTAYPEHNLIRTKTQFKLIEDMESEWDELVEFGKTL